MKISILTVFPSLYDCFLKTSLVSRAQQQGLITVDTQSFFSYVAPKERIDAATFGPGAGMVIRPDVVQKAIETTQTQHGPAFKIFFSPHGKKLTQPDLQSMYESIGKIGHVMLIPARYEGMDARIEEHYADEILSIGDFVLMGGDLPAMILLEGLLRLVPGVIGKVESVEKESFSGPFVDYPEYTAPVVWEDKQVPEIVRSGNHAAIAQWRTEQAVRRSVLGHFEWVRSYPLTDDEKALVYKTIPPHYVVLTHMHVLIGPERQPGTTSVTSIDIHDIARACATYGIKQFFIVTPLADQQKVVNTLLDFWQKGAGIEYNRVRHEAIKKVAVVGSMEEVISRIEAVESAKPHLVATSARRVAHEKEITFYDQAKVWHTGHPVLFVFGTGQGLTSQFVEECDFLLPPVKGFSTFNHLSVRSAAAIILDRWLGINEKKRN